MPSTTYLPNVLQHVVTKTTTLWLFVLALGLAALTSATPTLYGQEIDYRFNKPGEAVRLASKRSELASADKATAQSPSAAIVLVALRKSDNQGANSQTKVQPASQNRDCYQAPPLSAMSTNIALPTGKLPANAAVECSAETLANGDLRLAGGWATTEHHWSATCMKHRPLYFEEINAERFGYTPSYFFQPAISAARFFATIPALPYKMAIDHPRDCIYTLGHYRPGSCVPRRSNCLGWNSKAGAIEVGFIAAMILLVP